MNFKSTILAAALLVSSAVASANTAIVLTPSATITNSYSGTFAGYASTNVFDLDLTHFSSASNFVGQVSANFTGGAGYDVTGVSLDGTSFIPLLNLTIGNNGADYWQLLLPTLSNTIHHITVTGTPLVNTQGFVGSLSLNVTPVPEPETYAMLIAGLGLVGFMARRRKA
ncbi:FxDxF family PEP-CTERM protein [Duganella vulcania]|uniref:FxDxF family PEP-CTERM protein n=1 Tax=Duganella vulcania TaxID=2692166 RepID=UPI001C2DB3CD|nr:FxDxF family PEP-CTERM protein [Duganella vulcania]